MQEQKLRPKVENIFYLKITKFSKFDLFLSKIDIFRLFKKNPVPVQVHWLVENQLLRRKVSIFSSNKFGYGSVMVRRFWLRFGVRFGRTKNSRFGRSLMSWYSVENSTGKIFLPLSSSSWPRCSHVPLLHMLSTIDLPNPEKSPTDQ